MFHRKMTIALCALALSCAALPGQCTNVSNVIFTSYGVGCPQGGGLQFGPTLSGTWDPASCTAGIQLTGGGPFCCNTFLQARILIVGLQPLNLLRRGGRGEIEVLVCHLE